MNEQEIENENVLNSVRAADYLTFTDSDLVINIRVSTCSDRPAYMSFDDVDDEYVFEEERDFDDLIGLLTDAKQAFMAVRKWDVR